MAAKDEEGYSQKLPSRLAVLLTITKKALPVMGTSRAVVSRTRRLLINAAIL